MNAEQTRNNAAIEERHWWFAARRGIVRDLVHDLVPPSKQSLVIDVGCGSGGNTGALCRDYRCVGIDSSPEAIELASRKFPEARFIRGDVPRDLDGLLGEASLVMMMDVIEHVSDDFAMFSSVAAETKPGTHFLITVPAEDALWSKHDEASLHYRRYEAPRLRRVWEGLPFTTRLFTPFNARLYPLVKTARNVNNALGRTSGDAGTDMRVPMAPVNAALRSAFASEGPALRRALAEGRTAPFRHGVSLLAILRREAGEIRVRTKPSDVPRDRHDPHAAA